VSANPYAIPEANLEVVSTSTNPLGCWRIGRDILYVPRYAALPRRCVKCNAPAPAGGKQRSFYWHSSMLYLLIFIGILIYAIVAMFVRKKVELSPALCDAHAGKRTRTIWAAIGLLFAGIAGAWIAGSMDNPWLTFGSFFGGLVACIVVAFSARIIYPVHIDERGARFKGCGPAFLASLDANRPY